MSQKREVERQGVGERIGKIEDEVPEEIDGRERGRGEELDGDRRRRKRGRRYRVEETVRETVRINGGRNKEKRMSRKTPGAEPWGRRQWGRETEWNGRAVVDKYINSYICIVHL